MLTNNICNPAVQNKELSASQWYKPRPKLWTSTYVKYKTNYFF